MRCITRKIIIVNNLSHVDNSKKYTEVCSTSAYTSGKFLQQISCADNVNKSDTFSKMIRSFY